MFRVDRSVFKHKTTAEGFLTGDAIVTRTGVFQYVNNDGTIRHELRHPDDVFNADSLASLKLKPVTDNHPPELVNSDNANVYAIGSTGESVTIDENSVAIKFSVHRKDAIKKVANGKRELSLGYKLDLIEESGVWDGVPYTHRQKNIRYNHLAIVDQARAGRMARINMDGFAVQLHHDEEDKSMTDKEMQTVNLDGLTYRADAEVAKAYEKALSAKEKALNAEKQVRMDAEALKGQVDELKAQLEAVKATHNDEAMAKAVAERVALLETVKRVVNIDGLQGSSDRLIKETVIKAKHEINLDGKSDDYVNARFDALIESLPSVEDEALAKQKQAVANVNRDTAQKADLRQVLNEKYHGGKA